MVVQPSSFGGGRRSSEWPYETVLDCGSTRTSCQSIVGLNNGMWEMLLDYEEAFGVETS